MTSAVSHSPSPAFDAGSFRDRAARVFYHDGRVFRALGTQADQEWRALAATSFYRRMVGEGRLVATEELAPESRPAGVGREWATVLRHDRVPFVSYPYEWCFGMLKDAALLHLDLELMALDEGMTLKDASAFNVQWRGVQPVFIDIASFERYGPGDPWVGYLQFCQHFLYPLFLQAYRELPYHAWLRGSPDGIEPEHCLACLSGLDRLRPGVIAHVILQAKARAKFGAVRRDLKRDLRAAGFSADLIRANVKRMRRLVEGLAWEPRESTWSAYETTCTYQAEDVDRKSAFVEAAAREHAGELAWDLGCNTGHYARLLARHASAVVALDADHLAIERLYRSLRREDDRRILPLVFNLANPSPDLGWRGAERQRLDRRGRPALVLCLALLHHLVIGANLPLAEVIGELAALGADLVIEFVGKQDPMVQRLLQNKADIYADYEWAPFEDLLGSSFVVERREMLASGTRALYFARARRVPASAAAHP